MGASVLALVVLVGAAARADHVEVGCEGFAPQDSGCTGTLRVERRGAIIIGVGFGPSAVATRLIISVQSETGYVEETCTSVWPVAGWCETSAEDGHFRRGQIANVRITATGVGYWQAYVRSI